MSHIAHTTQTTWSRLRSDAWFWVCAAYLVFALAVIGFVTAVVVFADDPGFVGVWQLLFVPVTWIAWEMPGSTDPEYGGGNLAVAQAWTLLLLVVSVALAYGAGRVVARAANA